MTLPIAPPAAPTVPNYPALGSPSFNQDAYTYATAMPGVSAALGALATNVAANGQVSHDNATAATQAALAAADARDVSAAAANFKGLWSSLAGPLNKPAAVKHNNRIWLLLNNLANVAASQPGVSADWTTGDSGELVQVVNASTTITPGPVYAVATAGVTVTMPASLQAGDMVHIRNVSGGQVFINWAAHTVKGRAPQSPMPVPLLRGVSLVYVGGTLT